MKRLRPSTATRHQGGFTLIELLVVIALVALLAAFSMVGIRAQQQRSREQDSKARLAMYKGLLEAYKTDNGEFPEEVAWDRTGEDKFGSVWPIGGGATLYQALTGDGTSEIKGFQAREGQNAGASTGEFGSSGTKIYLKDISGRQDSYVLKSDETYALIDGFGHPYAYRRYNKSQDGEFNNENTFDMWSYGTAESSEDSEASKKKWLTNWE